LNWFAIGFERRTRIRVTLEIAQSTRIPLPLELDLFRIVQEGLTNVARHSGSQKAVVRLDEQAGEIVLQIQDFGRGMRSPAGKEHGANKTAGVGISGMRERVRHAGGRLEIESSNDHGTIVRAIVPVPSPTTGLPSPETRSGSAPSG
jgi:signal transduction histidine kinase